MEGQANLRYRITGYFNSTAEFGFLSFKSVLLTLISSGLIGARRQTRAVKGIKQGEHVLAHLHLC
jgi:hypothetical protein